MRKRVTITDDSHFIVRQLSDFFEKTIGFEVVGKGYNGNEAVELYRTFKPDLATIDLQMPEKDGKTALKEILAEFPNARILVVSAVRGNTMLECLDIGAKAYIEKPLRFTNKHYIVDFKESVREAML